jgi:hypothetical protein
MLAQVFNLTEIKKNGPATRPAIAPARRVAFLLRPDGMVLPGTGQSYIEAVDRFHRDSRDDQDQHHESLGAARLPTARPVVVARSSAQLWVQAALALQRGSGVKNSCPNRVIAILRVRDASDLQCSAHLINP